MIIPEVGKSEFRTQLDVRVMDEEGCFELRRKLVYFSHFLNREIIVPATFVTDFASIPWMFHSFCKVNGKHRKAAVVHDFLCDEKVQKALGITQREADKVFLEAMEVLGTRWSQRKVMYRFVRQYQKTKALVKRIYGRFNRKPE